MSEIRSDSGSASLDGKVYVAGGFSGTKILKSVECFDLETVEWTYMPNMITRRSGFQLVAAFGELYALGGFDGQERLSKCEKFSFQENRWIAIPNMITGRSNFGAEVVHGKIVVAGGYNDPWPLNLAECFDPVTQTWSPLSDLTYRRSALSLAYVPGINLTFPEFRAPQKEVLPKGVSVLGDFEAPVEENNETINLESLFTEEM